MQTVAQEIAITERGVARVHAWGDGATSGLLRRKIYDMPIIAEVW